VRLGKRLSRSRLALIALSWVFARYIGLVYLTSRWRVQGREDAEALIRAGRPFIVAFWHGRLMMAPRGWRDGAPMHVMISRHRDGEWIARTVRHLGVEAIRGSASKGGASALRGSLRVLERGGYVGITPDGPRGPRMRAQPGIVMLAKLAQVPIVPATYAVSRRRLARSWDRFVIARPFGRGIYLWGAPIMVAEDADDAAMEAARLAVESRLNALTAEADRAVGVTPIEPAETAAESGRTVGPMAAAAEVR
jgi:lysophospholipid acyltransferase (LPLAT)-like uncharacterized protein